MMGTINWLPLYFILSLLPAANFLTNLILLGVPEKVNDELVIFDGPKKVEYSYNATGDCPLVADTAVIANRTITYKFCKQRFQQPNQNVIIGVLTSRSKGFDTRQTIRNTWARHATNVYFLVGGKKVDLRLQNEMKKYHDIIWFESPETYRNIVYKTLGFFAAVSVHGPNDYMFAFKTDDDVYIDMELLSATVNEEKDEDYIGDCFYENPVIRDPEHRWYVSEEAYPNATVFRPYANGPGYFVSRTLLSKSSSCILKNLANNPLIPIEDVAMAEVLRPCAGNTPTGTDCTYHHILDWFRGDLKQIETHQNESRIMALFDIKDDWVFHMVHVEYCLQHPKDVACMDYDMSCADPVLKSATCRPEGIHCGGIHFEETCGACAWNKWEQRVEPTWCQGECTWCEHDQRSNMSIRTQCIPKEQQCKTL